MALTTEQAYPVAMRAVPRALGRVVTDAEVWAVLAVGRKESGFGTWPSPPNASDMVTSRNWGAVQCVEHASRIRYLDELDAGPAGKARAVAKLGDLGSPSAVAGHCAMVLDYRPKRGWFVAPYRWYATDDEAAADVARILERNGALAAVRAQPDTYALADAMFRGGYYTGTSGNGAKEIPAYAASLANQVRDMAKRLGGVMPPLAPVEADPGGSAPFPAGTDRAGALVVLRRALAAELVDHVLTFRRRFIDPRVRELQADLNSRGAGLVVDGWFGPKTLRAWLSDPPGTP